MFFRLLSLAALLGAAFLVSGTSHAARPRARLIYGPIRLADAQPQLWKALPFTGALVIITDAKTAGADLKRLRAVVGKSFALSIELPTAQQPAFDHLPAWQERITAFRAICKAARPSGISEVILNTEDESAIQWLGMRWRLDPAKAWVGKPAFAEARYWELARAVREELPGVTLGQDIYSYPATTGTQCYRAALRTWLGQGGVSYQGDGMRRLPGMELSEKKAPFRPSAPVRVVPLLELGDTWLTGPDRRENFAFYVRKYAADPGIIGFQPYQCGEALVLPKVRKALPFFRETLAAVK